MAILYKDPRYEYTNQLSVWLKHVSELRTMLEPFTDGEAHAVVRHNRHGQYAVFTRGRATPKKRYKLEVLLGCKVTSNFTRARRRKPRK